MNRLSALELNRAFELLADRVVQELAGTDAAELDRLIIRAPELDDGSWERMAGEVAVAMAVAEQEPLPAHLRARLVNASRADGGSGAFRTDQSIGDSRARPGVALLWGGWLAAAACLVFAVAVWQSGLGGTTGERGGPVRVLTPVERRDELASVADVKRAAWQVLEDPSVGQGTTTGEVIWSDSRHEGYATIRGLAANDRTKEQYQIWVFDAKRDDKYPVEGGIFDVAAGQDEVVVPITPYLAVDNVVMLAISVERPGGVWVSDRSRLPLLAKFVQ